MCLCAFTYVPAPPGGLTKIASDPMKVVNEAVEESANVISVMLKFAANLIAPEEDEGTEKQTVHPIKLQRPELYHVEFCDYSLSDQIMTLQCIY